MVKIQKGILAFLDFGISITLVDTLFDRFHTPSGKDVPGKGMFVVVGVDIVMTTADGEEFL